MARHELPEGFLFRRPVPEDAQAIVEVMNAVDIAEIGEPDSSVEDLLAEWTQPRFDPKRDAWVVAGPERRIVAYAWAWDRKPSVEIQGDLYIHPTLANLGLEEPILDQLEARAEEHRGGAPRAEEVRLRLFNLAGDAARAALLGGRGYERVRTFWRMTIDLAHPLPEPRWPEGIAPRSFRPGVDEQALEATIQGAFADHFGFALEPHAEWVRRRTDHPSFDPFLWTLAWHGTDAAGGVLGYNFEGNGWVRELGVLPPWRGRGLGRALLLHSFAIFAARGFPKAGLGVDASNPTGATQLYESVGMRVASRHDLFEKRLGPGRGI